MSRTYRRTDPESKMGWVYQRPSQTYKKFVEPSNRKGYFYVWWELIDDYEMGSKEHKADIAKYHADHNCNWDRGTRIHKSENKRKARQATRKAIHDIMHGKADDFYLARIWEHYDDIWTWD